MMVLHYCKNGNLRNYLNQFGYYLDYKSRVQKLFLIARGLLGIHDSGKVHQDFHSRNILFNYVPFISDLGMCQPANNEEKLAKKEGVYGVLPYMAPEEQTALCRVVTFIHIYIIKHERTVITLNRLGTD
jgi:serine/threonine protein kinase